MRTIDRSAWRPHPLELNNGDTEQDIGIWVKREMVGGIYGREQGAAVGEPNKEAHILAPAAPVKETFS